MVASWAMVGLLACVATPAEWTRPGANLAAGRPYTLAPTPNYALCSHDEDRRLLTDGVYTSGYFWTQPTTTGWQGGVTPRIVVDLGSVRPIGGASYQCAAGRAGVEWPTAILLLVSDDGTHWYRAGELVSGDREPAPPAEYAEHRYWTDKLACRGRYVAFIVAAPGSYSFCDEVEVYAGPEALLAQPPTGTPLASLDEAVTRYLYLTQVISAEAARIRAAITERSPAAERDRLLAELAAAERGLDALTATSERPELPFGPADRAVWAVRAALWRAQGQPALRAWQTSRWDPLTLGQEPAATDAPPKLAFAMLRDEQRGEVINVTSAADRELACQVSTEGVPGSPRPPWLTVRRVAWTLTKGGGAVACALPTADGNRVALPAGLTQQIWLEVDSSKLAPGDHRGNLLLSPAGLLSPDGLPAVRVPLSLHVSRLAMPARLSLSLGGWDYTDSPGRGITEGNLADTVAFLREHRVDAPWATAGTMPLGDYDAAGNMTRPPSTARMDAWLDRWPEARYYCVFNAVGETLPDTEPARRRVTAWIRFWTDHLRGRGIAPGRLLLLLVDEPHSKEEDERIVSWARIVRQAAPEVVVFEDPTWSDPRGASPEMLSLSTMLCPNRPMWLGQREAFEQVFAAQRAAGRQLALYSCSGPVRSLDPYSYHLLQAWDCFRLGAVHEGFWAFGDSGGSAWREGQAGGTCFTPQFLDEAGNVTAKHMEAIREGRFDAEYLTLLRAAIAKAPAGPARDRAQALLDAAPARVLGATDADNLNWSAPKDRAVADRVRAEVLAALEVLGGG